MLQLECPDSQEKHSDGLPSGWKVSASGRSPEFEKFWNSNSDTEIASNRPDAAQRTPNQNYKSSSKAYK
jgi:hypothetical protein